MNKRAFLIPLSALLYSSCAYAQLNTYIVNTTADLTVDSSGNIPGGGVSLRSAILQANATGAPKGIVESSYNLITFDPNVFSTPQTITLGNSLPLIFSSVNIEGPTSGVSLGGQNAYRGLFVSGLPTSGNGAPQSITVNFSNLNLNNMLAQGGNGSAGGGGGMGAGGALFVNQNATVTATNVSYINSQSVGGDGSTGSGGGGGGLGGSAGSGVGGGGGGMSGNGGTGNIVVGAVGKNIGGEGGIGGGGGGSGAQVSGIGASGGGGGGGGMGGNGGNTLGGGGGFGGGMGQILQAQNFAAAGNGNSSSVAQGGLNGGGGGGGGEEGVFGNNGDASGNGGIGVSFVYSANGGGGGGNNGSNGGEDSATSSFGGFGGGGGGGFYGGSGGFGGGGGGGSVGLVNSGNGGFGGGGGSAFSGIACGSGGFGGGGGSFDGSGGFGGGKGDAVQGTGGGGAAMGGGIFVADGGSLTISGEGTLAGNTLRPGNGGTSAQNGQAFGQGIFLHGNGQLTFSIEEGQTQTCADDISDQIGSGDSSGSWGLIVNGGGVLSLKGHNTYTGGTIIDTSTFLEVSTDSLPNHNVNIMNSGNVINNGMLSFSQKFTGSFSGNISGAGKVEVVEGRVILSGQNTNTGGIEIAPSAFLEGATQNFPTINSQVMDSGNIVDNGTLTFNQPQNISGTFEGSISGLGNVIVEGSNVNFTGSISPTIITTVQNGASITSNASNIAGNIVNNGAVTFNQIVPGTYAGNISGTGSLIKQGIGHLTLTNPTAYTGTTTISEGTLTLNPTNSGFTTNITNNSELVFTPSLPGFYDFFGNISGTGSVVLESTTGPFTLNLAGKTSYTGNTKINSAATLQGALPKDASLNLNAAGATYALSGDNQAIAVLNGNSGTFVNLGGNILTIGGNESPSTFNGVLQDNNLGGSLRKIGTQNLTIGALPSYLGSTTIAGGSLTGLLPVNTPLIIHDGTFQMVMNQTLKTLEGHGGSIILGASSTPYNLSIQGDSTPTKYTFTGSIMGGGQFNLGSAATTGILELTGNNTYTGNTSIFPGSTLISSINNLPPNGNITNNGNLIFNQPQSTAGTFAGIIAGLGDIEVTGGGKLTLTGIGNSYKRMTINQGTTLVGNTNTLSANPTVIVSHALLTFNQNFSGTFAADITGEGAVHLQGGGSVTLGGNNTYAGGTDIANDGSNLIVTIFDKTSSSLPLASNVIDNGTLTFNQPIPGTIFTFGGNIKGLGEVIVIGPGQIKLTGMNSHKGGTIIQNNGGVIGNTNSISGNIVNNGVVTFNQVAPGTYAGSISGTGSLIKQGIAPLTLKGVSLLTGQTTVKEGALSVQGGLPKSHVVVEKIASLKGTGDIGSADIKGRIMPGHSIGVLQILNDFVMKPTATYEAEVSVNGADTILVGGEAQLAGTLDLRSFKTKRPQLKNKSFTLLTAGIRRQGVFAHTSTDRLKYTVQYLPQSVQVLIGNMQDFTDAFPPGDNSNAEKTATYFDTFADNRTLSPDLRQVINGLDNFLQAGDSAAVQNAFNQIQPSQYKELGQISFLQNELVNRTVGSQQQNLRESLGLEKELEAYAESATLSPQRVASFHHLAKSAKGLRSSTLLSQSQPRHRIGMLAFPGSERVGMPANNWIKLGRSSVWVQSYGQIERTTGNHGNAGIRSETGGISLGGDHEVLKNTYLGFLGGMSTTAFHWQQGRGSGRVKSYYGGIYGTWLSQTGFYADGQLIAGGDNYNSHRNIVYPGVNRKARQSHNGGQFSTDLQAGYVWSLKHLTVQPYADATYMFVNESGFREKGAQSLDFKIKGRMSQFFRGEIGAQVYKTYVLRDALVRPALQLSWVHKRSMGPNSAKVQGGLVGQAQSLSVAGDNRTRNQVAPGLALTVQFAKGLYIIGNVSSQFGGGQKLGDALIRVGYDF